MPLDQAIFDRLAAIVGPNACLTDLSAMAPYLHEERGLYHGKAAMVVRPAMTNPSLWSRACIWPAQRRGGNA